MDVQIHGGLARDALAGRRSSATAAAPGARMLVHSIAYDRGDRVGGSGRMDRAGSPSGKLSVKALGKYSQMIIPVW